MAISQQSKDGAGGFESGECGEALPCRILSRYCPLYLSPLAWYTVACSPAFCARWSHDFHSCSVFWPPPSNFCRQRGSYVSNATPTQEHSSAVQSPRTISPDPPGGPSERQTLCHALVRQGNLSSGRRGAYDSAGMQLRVSREGLVTWYRCESSSPKPVTPALCVPVPLSDRVLFVASVRDVWFPEPRDGSLLDPVILVPCPFFLPSPSRSQGEMDGAEVSPRSDWHWQLGFSEPFFSRIE